MSEAELKKQIDALNKEIDELRNGINEEIGEIAEERDEAMAELERTMGRFDDALTAFRARRIDDCLYRLERALPGEFAGFSDVVMKARAS